MQGRCQLRSGCSQLQQSHCIFLEDTVGPGIKDPWGVQSQLGKFMSNIGGRHRREKSISARVVRPPRGPAVRLGSHTPRYAHHDALNISWGPAVPVVLLFQKRSPRFDGKAPALESTADLSRRTFYALQRFALNPSQDCNKQPRRIPRRGK